MSQILVGDNNWLYSQPGYGTYLPRSKKSQIMYSAVHAL